MIDDCVEKVATNNRFDSHSNHSLPFNYGERSEMTQEQVKL